VIEAHVQRTSELSVVLHHVVKDLPINQSISVSTTQYRLYKQSVASPGFDVSGN